MKQKLSKKRLIKRVSIIIIITVLSYVIVSMAGSAIAFRFIFARTNTVNAFELTYADIDSNQYPRREVYFDSGGNRLFGCVYAASKEPEGLVVVANGMNSCIDRHLPEIMYFVDSGFSVLTFENTGVGNSEGDGTVGLAQARLDTAAAVEFAKRDRQLRGLPVVLYGHSLGGYAAAVTLEDEQDIAAAVCVSGFASPNQNMLYNAKKHAGILAEIQYPFMCLQNYFLFGGKADASAVDAINASETPVMIVGGNSDDIVPGEISLLHQAENITNPNAVIVEISEEYRGEHSTVWLSSESARYLAENESPDDKQKANVLDEEFMQSVVGFYRTAIKKK